MNEGKRESAQTQFCAARRDPLVQPPHSASPFFVGPPQPMQSCTSLRGGAPSARAPARSSAHARHGRAGAVLTRAFGPGNEMKEGVEAGTRVKVTASIKVRAGGVWEGDAPGMAARAGLEQGQPRGRGENDEDSALVSLALSRHSRQHPPLSLPPQVYHVPKTAELNIEGMTGTVADVVKFFKVRERRGRSKRSGPRPFRPTPFAPPSHSRPPPLLSLPLFS